MDLSQAARDYVGHHGDQSDVMDFVKYLCQNHHRHSTLTGGVLRYENRRLQYLPSVRRFANFLIQGGEPSSDEEDHELSSSEESSDGLRHDRPTSTGGVSKRRRLDTVAGEEADEGPFGDHTGYYNEVERFPAWSIRLNKGFSQDELVEWLKDPNHFTLNIDPFVYNDHYKVLAFSLEDLEKSNVIKNTKDTSASASASTLAQSEILEPCQYVNNIFLPKYTLEKNEEDRTEKYISLKYLCGRVQYNDDRVFLATPIKEFWVPQPLGFWKRLLQMFFGPRNHRQLKINNIATKKMIKSNDLRMATISQKDGNKDNFPYHRDLYYTNSVVKMLKKYSGKFFFRVLNTYLRCDRDETKFKIFCRDNWIGIEDVEEWKEQLKKISLDKRIDFVIVNLEEAIRTLDQGFQQFGIREARDYVVYRGSRRSIEQQDERVYKSTSINKDVAVGFVDGACCVYEITIPAGYPVLDMTVHSGFTSEQEWLLPRGTKLIPYGKARFENKEQNSNNSGDTNQRIIIVPCKVSMSEECLQYYNQMIDKCCKSYAVVDIVPEEGGATK